MLRQEPQEDPEFSIVTDIRTSLTNKNLQTDLVAATETHNNDAGSSAGAAADDSYIQTLSRSSPSSSGELGTSLERAASVSRGEVLEIEADAKIQLKVCRVVAANKVVILPTN